MAYLNIERSQHGLYSKFLSLIDDELVWYENEALKQFGLSKLPKRQSDQLIQQMIGKSPDDDLKKKSNKLYYISNVIAYLHVTRNMLTADFIDKFDIKNKLDDVKIYNYYHLFQALIFDSLVLLNEYCVNIKKTEAEYGVGKPIVQHTLPLYQSLRQFIYGQSSFHSFIDMEPDVSIVIIRQLIELKIRRAFGVLGWYNIDSESMTPMPLTHIFDTIKTHQKEIDFSIPLDCLIRIYGWANIFLHIGIKDYVWKHIFVANYIKEFAIGKNDKINVSDGIVIPKQVLDEIHNTLENDAKNEARKKQRSENIKIISCNPEARII